MTMKYILTSVIASAGIAVSIPLFANEAERTETRTYTKANGDTVTIEKTEALDEMGLSRSREFHITDSDGDPVAAGRDRGYENRDGSEGSSQTGVKYDDDGNRIVKARQEQSDGDGNTRSRRGKSVRDEDGNPIARGIDGEASRNGNEYRAQKRQRVQPDGDRVTGVRHGKVDAAGNKTVVTKKKTKSGSPGSLTRQGGGKKGGQARTRRR